MKRCLLVLAALCLLPACVSVPPASKVATESVDAWRGKTVATTTRSREALVAMTAGKATFAMLGALAMIEAGKKIVADNGIDDPVPLLSQELLQAAMQKYTLQPAAAGTVTVATDDVAKLAQAAGSADLLLDVQSLGATFRYFPTNWTHYAVDSAFIVRLIDVKGKRLAAGGMCRLTSEKEPNPPTHEELLADRAQRLKAILESQRASCSQKFKVEVLNIEG